ncbi:CLUMA_CG014377, isoform A [Clunio marinus]|uniref:CLUMA_CG014377, isoform A n=1 Tax=Clunio marinus TaxID=568069 RepID=A0A1J1IRV0_9DIPT|nr:CLUMA_CG014377, isoform A [Clunio marinus]
MNVKVSEIFTSAGKAFNTLGDLILQVQTDKESNSKWSQEEVDMLKNSVTTFNEDLNQLSSHIKAKQTSQIRQTIKNKSYQQAGLSNKADASKVVSGTQVQQQSSPVIIQEQVIFQPQSIKIEHQLPDTLVQVSNSTPTTSQMTLNRLNAQQEEIEMDVEDFRADGVKIEYGASTEVS